MNRQVEPLVYGVLAALVAFLITWLVFDTPGGSATIYAIIVGAVAAAGRWYQLRSRP